MRLRRLACINLVRSFVFMLFISEKMRSYALAFRGVERDEQQDGGEPQHVSVHLKETGHLHKEIDC